MDMDQAGHAIMAANLIYARANTTSTDADTETRPAIYKAIGISLAIASGLFIGVSFVLKKMGLLKANEKYDEAAGEGYAYLKNAFWWTGMTLMIIGEICNFVAYAFVDAILVTPLGALSVVITTILSAIFLKERLSMVGKVGCFLCIIGSVVIVMNAPSESSAATIQEMQHFVIAPGFLTYAGVIIVGCTFTAFWAGPRYGKKSMLVYLSICSLIGGLSVVATQGLGAAIVAQIGGTKQYNQWFLYVLFVFVICTLLTEIIFLNKALNLFNAALVTPTYYVMFTSSTIITSAILFKGFKGTPTSIITCVMGFFVICAGVVLLQLSKSAKDVPDTAVFAGDLDQVRTIAEQEQPESEPKADAIRGAAGIVRRMSKTRQKMEMDEAKRLHDEKARDLEPIGEDEHIEWDGLRRRRTTFGTNSSIRSSQRDSFPPVHNPTLADIQSGMTSTPTAPRTPATPRPHPPLGMSRFPTFDEQDEENRPNTASMFGGNFFGSLRKSGNGTSSPMHPVPLTEISIPGYKHGDETPYENYGDDHGQGYLPRLRDLSKTEYVGVNAGDRHITIVDGPTHSPPPGSRGSGLHAPTPPAHQAKRQFSFQNVFRKDRAASGDEATAAKSPSAKHASFPPRTRGISNASAMSKGATEEERLGLVKGDTQDSGQTPPSYDGDDDEGWLEDKQRMADRMGSPERMESLDGEGMEAAGRRNLTPPRLDGRNTPISEKELYEAQKRKWAERIERDEPPVPPKHGRKGGDGGAGGAYV